MTVPFHNTVQTKRKQQKVLRSMLNVDPTALLVMLNGNQIHIRLELPTDIAIHKPLLTEPIDMRFNTIENLHWMVNSSFPWSE